MGFRKVSGHLAITFPGRHHQAILTCCIVRIVDTISTAFMTTTITLESHSLAVTLSRHGARLVQLIAKRPNSELLLDTSCSDRALIDQCCLGSTVGPYAGRLRQADPITGLPSVMLHGGSAALHRADWALTHTHQPHTACYTTALKHNEGGLPGDRQFSVAYTLSNNSLTIDLTASTTHSTPINLTNHAYFTLGAKSVRELSLTVRAHSVLATDDAQCPTGELLPVAATALDLIGSRPLADVLVQLPNGLDHSYVLESDLSNTERLNEVAVLNNMATGMSLSIATTQPCLQVYTAAQLTAPLQPFSAICLEAQGFPDGPHHSWGKHTSVLPAGQTRSQRIVYRMMDCSPNQ